MFRFEVRHQLAAKHPSLAAGHVYGTFGLEAEQGERVYVEPFSLDVHPGQIVAFVGVSGSGKTSCLHQFIEQSDAVDISTIPSDPTKLIIENIKGDADRAMQLASLCGLAEAQLFLRYPQELSDGQHYRFRLAQALALGNDYLAADEFLATLDRPQARTIAFNIRKLVTDRKLVLAVATTHEDILDDLGPDHLVRFDGQQAVVGSTPRPKALRSSETLPLVEALVQIGTGSLSGTTAGPL